MYCAKCGGQVEASQRYCPSCGELVGGGMQPTASNPVPHQTPPTKNSTLKALGIVLCVFAPLAWILGPAVTFLLGQFMIAFGSEVGAIVIGTASALPLAILLIAIGAKSLAESKKGNPAYKYAGIADFLLAGTQLVKGISHGFSNTTAWLINESGMSREAISAIFSIISILTTALLIATVVLYVVAAFKKKAAGEKGTVLIVAGVLFGVYALVALANPTGRLIPFLVQQGGDLSQVMLITSSLSMSIGLLYTAGLVFRAVSLIRKKERTVPVSPVQGTVPASPAQNVVPIPAGQAIPAAGDASSMGFTVLSFFFPLVGLILYLIWKDQHPLKAKSCGKGALTGVIVLVVLCILMFGLIVLAAMFM